VQIKAVLNCHYKVFKDKLVLMFDSREMMRYYGNRLRQLLSLPDVMDSANQPEATLPPVSAAVIQLLLT